MLLSLSREVIFLKKLICCIVIVFFIGAPVLAADLQGGYYMVADSALGTRTFYVPSDFASNCITFDENGYAFNLTGSSIYLYCPDYPNYTIYAPRLSVFQYRNNDVGYNYQDLNLRNVSDTNVVFLEESPSPLPPVEWLLVIIASALIAFFGGWVILRKV